VAAKYQLITEVYESALRDVTGTPAHWTAFLASACRNYKCRFDEQVLIYAQRPDATAVLEIEKWNKNFGRWVNRGAKGIAVFDDAHGGKSRLKHYFDVSDTHTGRGARPVPIWQMASRHEAEVIEHLENTFGELEDTSTLAAALISAAQNATDDNLPDYLSELVSCREGSSLGGLDEQGVEDRYRSALTSSVAYMLLVRCGIDPARHLDAEGFRHIASFNTRQTANALGMATSDIAESCLREIAATVLNLQRSELSQNRTFERTPVSSDTVVRHSTERSHGHGRDDIPDRGRLSGAEPGHAQGGPPSPWQVRIAAKGVPEKAPARDVREPSDELYAERASGTDRADGKRTDGAYDNTDGGGAKRGREPESPRPDEVGGTDEQHQEQRGGSDTERPDIRIKPLPTQAVQLSLFNEAEDEKSPASSVSSPIAPMQPATSPNETAEYDLWPGVSVWLGLDEYEILSLDSAAVILRDMKSPLFPLDMSRADFDRKLRENSSNDGLIKADDVSEAAPQEPKQEPVHQEYQPGFETLSEPVEADNAPERPGEPPDDADASLPKEQLPAEKEEVITPSWEKPKHRSRATVFDVHPEIPLSERHNFRIADNNLGVGGQKTRFKNNVAAIKVLGAVEVENRFATPQEQEILAKYVGWGSLSQAFDKNHKDWTDEYAELHALLSPKDWKSARDTTVNAHYTSPTVIGAIYKAVENMGFTTGNVLEPSCGIGNFFGLVPESMADSKLFGVEIDNLTGRIARQLYQKSSIAIQGFEDTELPDSFFDLAVGNVPFGEYKVSDKRYDKHSFLIHDYFFARTLDKVRPGGVIAFITSKGTLDKKNPIGRKYIAQRAELLGAIRLPNTAFKANAGTEVTADIIFLQKRDRAIDIEPDWVHLGQTDTGVPVNNYFAEHPDMVLGEMVYDGSMYGNSKDTACHPFPESDLAEQLAEAIVNIHAEITEYELDADEPEEDTSIPADPNVRNFSYTIVEGKIYYRQDSRMAFAEMPVTAQNRVKGLIGLRECTRELIACQSENDPDSDIAAGQAKLNRLYDSFTRKYGLINSRGNNMAFSQDSAYPLLCSLEVIDENGELERKADMFSKRTIKPHSPVTHVDTTTEALAVSISERARVDLAYMSELSGMTEDVLIDGLKGVIFLNIGSAQSQDKTYVTAGEYLSGNIREKLAQARTAQQAFPDGRYDVNAKALEAAMPKDLTAADISVRLGATWIPEDVVQQFMYELLETSWRAKARVKVHYSKSTGAWNVTEKSCDRSNIHVFNTYGTQRAGAYKIIEESLNLRDVRVWDKIHDEHGDEKRVINKRETAIAQSKQEAIRLKFEEWVWSNPARRERLCRIYNDTFNSIRPREYDGSHLMFPGMNPEITLQKHQVDAIARILYGGNTLLAHEVGAGKTFEMVAAAMESKRLGLCNKSLVVVPNHITEQWASEWLQLYPSANILVATKKDFETGNRRKFCARIATGDYDAVIIGHSQFEKIPLSLARQAAMIDRQIEDIVGGIAEVKENNGERFTIKQMVKLKKSLEARQKKLNDQSRKDDVVTFEELGVDRLFVDEAHYFKNLFLSTKMRNVGGIAQTEAQKSSDLYMKCRYLDEMTGGRGVVFATGTPISNSMVELYTMQRYLQYATLERNGLQHFDSWASTFGETVTAIELAPEGTGYRAKTRFAKFFNLPELMSMFKMAADIQTADMLHLPVPKANFHNVVMKPSEWQRDMVSELAERAGLIRAGAVDPTEDNMLKVTNDGRKLALDQRLANELLPDDPEGKIASCADNVFRIWDETKEARLTQLVFCDLSTPHGDGKFNVYDDMKQKLIAKGMPTEEISFIHDANTEARKKELFARVRKGHIRILLGSTQKMGAGTNVQDRLIALHDLDCPWRPSDLAQRLGRIVRQGNRNEEVEIFRYVTESTFDSYLYQLVENKQKFIAQVMTSKTPVRIAEDVDETALSYAEIKALATGNPLIIEKCQLEMEVNKLRLLQGSHNSQKYALEDKILKEYPQAIKRLSERIAGFEVDVGTASRHPSEKDRFPPMKIGGNFFMEKADAGRAIIGAIGAMTSPDPVPLGEYRGFAMILSFDGFSKEYRVTLSGALSHTVKLGSDIHGNITRLDNALDGFTASLDRCKMQLEETQAQMDTARSEVARPFAQEAELVAKSKRLRAVNSLLNMDERDSVVLDGAPDEGEAEPLRKIADRER
jgi:N12 class adenine-specific DNA methylase